MSGQIFYVFQMSGFSANSTETIKNHWLMKEENNAVYYIQTAN
jgi:hypothetical protein